MKANRKKSLKETICMHSYSLVLVLSFFFGRSERDDYTFLEAILLSPMILSLGVKSWGREGVVIMISVCRQAVGSNGQLFASVLAGMESIENT
jgi:hypothetical protein